MVIRMRHTRGHTRNRRSHHALEGERLSTCADCKALHKRHNACMACGKYRGKQVIDIQAKIDKKVKKEQAKQKQAK